MLITILDVKSGKQSGIEMSGKTLLVGSGDDNDLILSEIAGKQLQIINDRHNLLVTNLDGSTSVLLADRELRPNIPWVWSSGQDLRIGDHFALYHAGLSSAKTHGTTVSWNKLASSAFLALIAGFLLLSFFRLINSTNSRIHKMRQNSSAMATYAMTATRTSEATTTMTVTQQTIPLTTIQAPTPLPILPPLQAISVDVIQPSNSTETQTITSTIESGISEVAPTATPILETSWLTTEVWAGDVLQPSLLDALEVDFVPAMIVRGQPFWHLQKVIWLNEAESNGRHHIYVDVRDKNGRRLVDKTVAVTWPNGSCARLTVERANDFDKPWSDFGADCAMFSAGRVYSVWIFGAPSDQLIGLGLGVPGNRDMPILTSYLLVFQEAVLN